jgi:hypothetical protein
MKIQQKYLVERKNSKNKKLIEPLQGEAMQIKKKIKRHIHHLGNIHNKIRFN